MTYQEAQSYLNRIKDTVIGAPVKSRLIQSLTIAPTDWEQMNDFLNLRVKVGDEAVLIEFSSRGKSLSVYGVSVTMIEEDLSRYDMTNLDNWE